MPWFDVPNRATRDVTTVRPLVHAGPAAAPDVICLDTGCVWGGALTALRLQDRKLVQVKCSRFQDPNSD